MTLPRRVVADIAEVNPRLPAGLASDLSRHVDFVPMADLSDEGVLRPKDTRELRDVIKGYTYFQNGDVIVAKITPCMENGKAAYVDNLPSGIGFGSTEFHVLRPGRDVDGQYLFWMIWGEDFRQTAQSNMTGSAGQKRVPASFFARYTIPLPPLEDQRRIAAILAAADALRARRRASIEQLDSLLQSVFLEMFGDPVTNPKAWEEVAFGAVVNDSFRNGLSPSRKGTVAGEVLTLTAITTGRFSIEHRKTAYFDHAPTEEQTVSQETFLICRGNGNKRLVGAGAFPDCTRQTICFPDTMIGVTLTPGRMNGKYLHTVWSSLRVRQQIERAARTTNGTYKVNQQMLAAVTLPLPPLELQERFASFVESVERQRSLLSDQLVTLEQLFTSLQSRAFEGKLPLPPVPSQTASA